MKAADFFICSQIYEEIKDEDEEVLLILLIYANNINV